MATEIYLYCYIAAKQQPKRTYAGTLVSTRHAWTRPWSIPIWSIPIPKKQTKGTIWNTTTFASASRPQPPSVPPSSLATPAVSLRSLVLLVLLLGQVHWAEFAAGGRALAALVGRGLKHRRRRWSTEQNTSCPGQEWIRALPSLPPLEHALAAQVGRQSAGLQTSQRLELGTSALLERGPLCWCRGVGLLIHLVRVVSRVRCLCVSAW